MIIKNSIGMLAALVGSANLVAAGAHAQQSAAMYDEKQTITVEGVVTKYEWANPHVIIYVKRLASAGQAVDWQIDGGPPSILRRLGWSQDALKAGDAITVTGMPSRDPNRKSLLPISIKRGDAMLFDRKTELTRLASVAIASSSPGGDSGLEGVWVTLLALQVEGSLDPKKLSLTSKGAAAVKHFDEKTMDPRTDCVAAPAPFFMTTPDLKRISRADGVILIDGEFDDARRIVHMDGSARDVSSESIQGYSTGRWEGRSLIIDTARFSYHALGDAYGLPSGAGKHLVERLTPDEEGTSLTYHFEMTDPEYLAAPVKGDARWVYSPDQRYAPDKCDLENAKHFIAH